MKMTTINNAADITTVLNDYSPLFVHLDNKHYNTIYEPCTITDLAWVRYGKFFHRGAHKEYKNALHLLIYGSHTHVIVEKKIFLLSLVRRSYELKTNEVITFCQMMKCNYFKRDDRKYLYKWSTYFLDHYLSGDALDASLEVLMAFRSRECLNMVRLFLPKSVIAYDKIDFEVDDDNVISRIIGEVARDDWHPQGFSDFFKKSPSFRKVVSTQVADVVEVLFDRYVQKFGSAIKKGIGAFVSTAAILWAFRTVRNKSSSTADKVLAVVLVVTLLVVDDSLVTVLMSFFSIKASSESGRDVPQADDLHLEFATEGMTAALCCLPLFSVLSDMGTDPKTLVRQFSEFGKLGQNHKGLKELVKALVGFAEKCWATFTGKLGLPSIPNGTGNTQLDQYFKEVEIIKTKQVENKLYLTMENRLWVDKVVRMGDFLLTSKVPYVFPEFKATLLKCQHAMVEIQKIFSSANVSEIGLRFETIGIMIVGPPAAKKSVLGKFLADDCVALDCSPEELEIHTQQDRSFIFNWQAENKFMNGFHDAIKVIFSDDYGQAVPDKSNPDGESMQSIRMLNSFPHEMHSAKMEEKGNLRNYAKFAIATTNLRKLEPKDITTKRALQRRWNGWYVTLKPEYLVDGGGNTTDFNEIVDDSKFQGPDGSPIVVTKDMYVFYKYSWQTNSSDRSKPYSYLELMDDIKAKYLFNYKVYARNQKTYLDAFKKTTKDLEKSGFYEEVDEIRQEISNLKQARFVPQMRFFPRKEDTPIPMPGSFEVEIPTFDLVEEIPVLEVVKKHRTSISPREEQIAQVLPLLTYKKKQWLIACLLNSEPGFYYVFASTMKDQKIDLGGDRCCACLAWHLLCSNKAYFDVYIKPPEVDSFMSMRYEPPLYVEKVECGWEVEALKCAVSTLDSLSQTSSDVIKFIGESCYGVTKPLMEFAEEHPVITTLAVFTGVFGIYATITGDNTFEVPQGAYEGHAPANKPQKIRSLAALRQEKPQIWSNGVSSAANIYGKNVLSICVGEKVMGSFIMIKGKVGVCCLHYVLYFTSKCDEDDQYGDNVIDFVKEGSILFKMTVKDFLGLFSGSDELANYSNDFVFFQLPRYCPDFKDISQKFVKRDYYLKHSSLDLCAYFKSVGALSTFKGTAFFTNYKSELTAGKYTYDLTSIIQYDVPTEAGDCGSPLIVLNPSANAHRILGMHAAGNGSGKKGLSVIITQEDVDEKLALLPVQTVLEDETVVEEGLAPQLLTGLDFEGESTLVKHKVGLTHSKTESPIANITPQLKPNKKLSRLEQFGNVSPLYNSLAKYKRDPLPYNPDEPYLYAKVDLLEKVEAMPKPTDISLPTVEQCVFGDPDDPYVDGVKSKSSPGPLLKQIDFIMKARIFETRDVNSSAFKKFKNMFLEQEKRLCEGKRINDFFSFNLKAELVSQEKWELGKTRGFFGAGMLTVALFNKYFGRFMCMFAEQGLEMNTAIGMNCLSLDWERLVQKLRKFDDRVYPHVSDGDFASYDCSHQKHLLWDIYDIIDAWYDDADGASHIRKILWMEVVNARIVFNKCIFSLAVGMTSGISLTTVINCLVNLFLHRYAFYDIFPQHRGHYFDAYVYLCVLGDDHIFSCVKHLRKMYCQKNISISLAKLGYVLTSSDKGSELAVDHFSLNKISFLKRSFAYESTFPFCLAPLDKMTIHEVPLWTQKGELSEEIFVSNVNLALRESAVWGRHFYSTTRKILMAGVMKTNRSLELFDFDLSYMEMMSRIYPELIPSL